MLASIAALIYVMDQYRLRAQYAAEREQDLQMAQELQQTTSAYLVYFNGTYIEVRLQSQFPYSYEVVGLSIRLANGSPLVVTGSGPSANVTVVGPYGIIYGLPASAGPAQQLMVIVKLTQGLVVSQANMAVILRSGDAVTAVPVTVYLPPGTSRGVSVNNETSVMELIETKVITNLVLIVSPSKKIAIPKAYTVMNLTPIVLYNPTGDPTPTGLTVNFTINLSSGIVKRNAISAKDGTGVVPLANVLFAIWNGTGWDPLDGWIEFYNSTAAEVWVKLDRSIEPYGNQTIFMLFLNGSTLGTINWGVNSYYTKNLSTDNIGYVMQGGVLYQVYIDANGSLYNSGGGVVGKALPSSCNALWNSNKYELVGLAYNGLGRFLYNLPLYGVSGAFTNNTITCVLVYKSATASGSKLYYYYSPTNPTLSFNNTYTCKGTYGGLFLPYGEPQLATPANEPVLASTLSLLQPVLVSGYDVLFNYGQGFIGGNPWPYGLSSAQVNLTWLVKGLGWIQLSSTNVNLSVTTDDGTMVLLGTSPGGGNFTNWLGAYTRSKAILPIWAEDYPNSPSYANPVTFEAPLSSLVNKAGDYRVVIEYFQDDSRNSYLAVFLPGSSMAANLTWYAPVFPPGGSYPYAFAPLAPSLLLGPHAPVQGWIVG